MPNNDDIRILAGKMSRGDVFGNGHAFAGTAIMKTGDGERRVTLTGSVRIQRSDYENIAHYAGDAIIVVDAAGMENAVNLVMRLAGDRELRAIPADDPQCGLKATLIFDPDDEVGFEPVRIAYHVPPMYDGRIDPVLEEGPEPLDETGS
jgi:hypothetical protein